jgi:hypothetical protein
MPDNPIDTLTKYVTQLKNSINIKYLILFIIFTITSVRVGLKESPDATYDFILHVCCFGTLFTIILVFWFVIKNDEYIKKLSLIESDKKWAEHKKKILDEDNKEMDEHSKICDQYINKIKEGIFDILHITGYAKDKIFLTKLNNEETNIYCTFVLLQFSGKYRNMEIIDTPTLIKRAIHILNKHFNKLYNISYAERPLYARDPSSSICAIIGNLCDELGYKDSSLECYKIGMLVNDDRSAYRYAMHTPDLSIDTQFDKIKYFSRVQPNAQMYAIAQWNIGLCYRNIFKKLLCMNERSDKATEYADTASYHLQLAIKAYGTSTQDSEECYNLIKEIRGMETTLKNQCLQQKNLHKATGIYVSL